jgi:hypothetical protein
MAVFHCKHRTKRSEFLAGSAAIATGFSAGTAATLLTPPAKAEAALAGYPTPVVALSPNSYPAPLPPNPLIKGLSVDEPPGPNHESSLIYDFKGKVARMHGVGQGTGNGVTMNYDVEFGFMQGTYRATSGNVTTGTFFFY